MAEEKARLQFSCSPYRVYVPNVLLYKFVGQVAKELLSTVDLQVGLGLLVQMLENLNGITEDVTQLYLSPPFRLSHCFIHVTIPLMGIE